MRSKFTSKFFTGNRQTLLKKTKLELIVIPAHRVMQRSMDTTYSFRQESNFWYLCGVEEPDCVLVITNNESFVILPRRDRVSEMFDGKMGEEAIKTRSGVQEVYGAKEGWQKLEKLIQTKKPVGHLPPMKRPHFDAAINPARRDLIVKLKRRSPRVKLQDIRKELAGMRMIKQPEELAALQRAVDITTDVIHEMFTSDWLARYSKEYKVEAAIGAGFRIRGASGHGYTPIVAAGKNAATIHYVQNNDSIKKGDMLLIDVGAEVENYSADISRTISSTGMNKRQQELFDAVQEVYEYARKRLKPRADYIAYEHAVEEKMGEVLIRLGVIKRPTRKEIRTYFPHRTSHMLGLDVHDAEHYESPLAENMVMTIEPGIYLHEEGLGVRIEDDVVLKGSGNTVMSKRLPLMLP